MFAESLNGKQKRDVPAEESLPSSIDGRDLKAIQNLQPSLFKEHRECGLKRTPLLMSKRVCPHHIQRSSNLSLSSSSSIDPQLGTHETHIPPPPLIISSLKTSKSTFPSMPRTLLPNLHPIHLLLQDFQSPILHPLTRRRDFPILGKDIRNRTHRRDALSLHQLPIAINQEK